MPDFSKLDPSVQGALIAVFGALAAALISSLAAGLFLFSRARIEAKAKAREMSMSRRMALCDRIAEGLDECEAILNGRQPPSDMPERLRGAVFELGDEVITSLVADVSYAIAVMANRVRVPVYGMTMELDATLRSIREHLGRITLDKKESPWQHGPCDHIPLQPFPMRTVNRIRRRIGRARDWAIEQWANRVWFIAGRVWARDWPPCPDCGYNGRKEHEHVESAESAGPTV